MSDIAGKIIKPTTEFLEDMGKRIPVALAKAHNRVGQLAHDAADHFDNVEDDLAGKARIHSPGGGEHFPRPGASDPGALSASENAAANDLREGEQAGAHGAHGDGDADGNVRGGDPDKDTIPKSEANCARDPIDVATGDMLLPQVDVRLPGSLPLVVERTHSSSFRHGKWFGRSWASTLDQRLQLDTQGVVFVAADGTRLTYPVPRAGTETLPLKGPRRPLTWSGDPNTPMRIGDPGTGRTLVFDHPRPAPGVTGGVVLRLAAVEDRWHRRIDIAWDDDVPALITHHGGYRVAVDRHPDLPRVTALRLLDADDATGPGTVLRRFGYDEAGDLTEVIDSTGLPLRFDYDADSRITGWTDRNGTRYGYVYDEAGRVTEVSGSEGYLSGTLTYDEPTRTTTVTDSLGHATAYRHNDAYRLIRRTDPLGNVTTQEWDARDRLVTATTDALGRTTRYEYDAMDNLTLVVRPDGTSAHAVYNRLGLPLEVTEPGGQVWRHEYDERGNRLTTTDPLGARTRFTSDGTGHLIAVTDALGHTRHVTNNAAGLPVAVDDALGNTTRIGRDAFGRVSVRDDRSGGTTRFEWTTEGLPARRERADGSCETWERDAEGNIVAHQDGAGHSVSHTYTHFDLPTSRTGADGVTYTFGYDTELNLTRVTDPRGLTWDYTYDAAGRPVSETDFNGRTLTYRHDAAGRLAARTDGTGRTTTLSRNALGAVVEQRSGDETTTFAYDAAGRLLRSANAHTSVVREHDAAGRLVAETVNGRRMSYAYDAMGRCVERRTPGGVASRWTYDVQGRPQELETAGHPTRFTFDADGREIARTFGDGLSVTQSWDQVGRLTSQSVAQGPEAGHTLLQHREYAYRADGFLTGIQELTTGARHFDLDPRGRVTALHARGWTESYAYDSAGNLKRAATSGAEPVDAEREFSGTLLRRAGRTRFEYDAQGRVVRTVKRLLNGQTRTRTLTWDGADRLAETVTPDGTRWRYTYDSSGRRTAKQRLRADGTVAEETVFSWDGTRLAERTTDGGRTTTWDYAPGTYRPLTQVDRDLTREQVEVRFHAIVTDLLGTPTELLSPQGELAWRKRTTVWGDDLPDDTEAVDCPLRFPGQYADAETGWNYNLTRYYDPRTARYTAPDPLGLEPGPNDYAYVDNAARQADPLGLTPCDDPMDEDTEVTPTPTSLYHYTTEDSMNKIVESKEMYPSLLANNPKDARYGDGQYLTDIVPGTKTQGQLSAAFLRVPWAGKKFTHYVEVDTTGLNVVQGRPGVFVIPNSGNLDLTGRISSHGAN